MNDPILIENDVFVSELRWAIRQGETGLGGVPGLLKRILKEERWKKRVVQKTGEIIEFKTFREFVTTPPLEGLGADLDLINRICYADAESVSLLDRETTGKPGGDKKSEQYNLTVDNVNSGLPERPTGNALRYALRRLRRERPELHERVLGQELSANAAMIEAGFRDKTITVPIDPERAARSIKRHFTPAQQAELISFLRG